MADGKEVRTRTGRTLFTFALLATCSACGQSDAPDGGAPADTVPATCDGEGVRRAAGSESPLERGKVTVVATAPELASVGDNVWHVLVEDSGGEPVTGALVSLTAFMPAHGHGTPKVALTSEEGDGSYAISPVALSMPGVWVVDVTVTSDEAAGRGTFDLCVAR